MKLFYGVGACSLAPHIVMAELNMAYELEQVNLKDKTCASGNYNQINAKGSVPALIMDNGEMLTEGAVICQYLCDTKTEQTLFAKFGTLERTRTQEWLNFIATDIHKNFSPLFFARSIVKNEEGRNEMMNYYKNSLTNKFAFLSEKLGNNDFLTGKNFTIADAYLFTCMNWCQFVGLDYSNFTNIANYMKRVAERPAVMRAMKEEGLIK
jgi:glutathione S-transferase